MPKRKLLLADDSITIQKVVNLTFADEGIDVVSVGDGNSALEKLREDAPDIVLADVNMPGLTGYEICERIKENEDSERIPVVLLVGSFEPFDEDEAERVGADAYLTKPFQSISQLVDKVSELLGDEKEVVDSEPAGEDIFESEPPFGFSEIGDDSEVEHLEVPGEDENPYADFKDEDEFEMSEAFGEEDTAVSFDSDLAADDQIEEVSEDFFKTQPLSQTDLQSIAEDYETPGVPLVEAGLEGSEMHSVDLAEPGFDEEKVYEIEHEEAYSESEPVYTESEVSFEDLNDEDAFSSEPSGSIENAVFDDDPGPFVPADFDSDEDDDPFIPQPDAVSVLELDEINLLELPPVGPGEGANLEAPSLDAPNTAVETSDFENGSADDDFEPVETESWQSVDIDEAPDAVHFADTTEAGADETVEHHAATEEDGAELEDVAARYEEETETVSAGDEAESSAPEVGKMETTGEEPGFSVAVPLPPRPANDVVENEVRQLVSKEMVEAITQRVIETLSEKAIREIAWEVVPDLADLIIKRMAEDKMKEPQ
ncbi:MAG: response regulator [Pyrinomonadaceae bacterium]